MSYLYRQCCFEIWLFYRKHCVHKPIYYPPYQQHFKFYIIVGYSPTMFHDILFILACFPITYAIIFCYSLWPEDQLINDTIKIMLSSTFEPRPPKMWTPNDFVSVVSETSILASSRLEIYLSFMFQKNYISTPIYKKSQSKARNKEARTIVTGFHTLVTSTPKQDTPIFSFDRVNATTHLCDCDISEKKTTRQKHYSVSKLKKGPKPQSPPKSPNSSYTSYNCTIAFRFHRCFRTGQIIFINYLFIPYLLYNVYFRQFFGSTV